MATRISRLPPVVRYSECTPWSGAKAPWSATLRTSLTSLPIHLQHRPFVQIIIKVLGFRGQGGAVVAANRHPASLQPKPVARCPESASIKEA